MNSELYSKSEVNAHPHNKLVYQQKSKLDHCTKYNRDYFIFTAGLNVIILLH